MWRLALRGKQINSNSGWIFLAVVGLLLSMAGARIQQPDDSPGDALAWVNDRPVTSAQLSHAEKRLNTIIDVELSEAERLSVLDLLIDEELLLQRAESLGVVDAYPGVRKAIVQSVISEIVEEFLATPPDQQQLEQFYRHHRAVFERPARLVVAALRFDSLAAAQHAHTSLAGGEEWAELKASPAAKPLPYLPESPLPAHVLRRYLGPGPTSVALSLNPGDISHPVAGAGGAYLLRVSEAVAPSVPEYSNIEAVVREEYLSRGREIALTNKLAQLWQAADIQFNARVVADERPGKYVRRALQ